MVDKYRYRFPIAIALFRWGFSIAWQAPIVKIYQRPNLDAEDSMLIFMSMLDEDP
ncbi:hypothetical protein [Chamaesiphon sp. OTE_20_metabat_361]|uniref:hypothetical protein n=1 Tax=Chamaesiphon sp. OTE_20_metabat_361 TaxID=2964689 RepID=UPI00286B8DC8|nr:hypothetical protein [Chamaesiphon sp. OTE_20_metabat_361]